MENLVYHGSPYSGLKELKIKKGSHNLECVYATSNPAVPIIFMGKGRGDLDISISVDEEGQVVLTERREGVFEEIYKGKSGYLYTLSGENFKHYDFLWPPEVISMQNELVLSEEKIDDIYERLLECVKKGQLQLNFYPNRPKEMPLDNRDLIPKYIRYFKAGKQEALEELLSVYPEFAGDLSLYPELNISPQMLKTQKQSMSK